MKGEKVMNLTQAGAFNPDVKVFENSLRADTNIDRTDVGQYRAVLSIPVANIENLQCEIFDNFTGEEDNYQIKARVEDNDRIEIRTLKNGIPTDGLMQGTRFKIINYEN